MRLLEAANVNPPAGSGGPRDGRWFLGYSNAARQCAMHMETEDPCGGEANGAIIGDVTDRKGDYWVQPVNVRSFLRQSVSCEQPDDKDFFRQAVAAKLEYVAARYLVVELAPAVQTWIGDAGVQSVALAGNTAAQYRTAVAEAYDLWHSTVADVHSEPVLHVPPALVPDLEAANILAVTGPREISSVYSPKVVASPGYDTATPKVFFTGEVVVRISGIDEEGGPLYEARLNNVTISANQVLAVDVAPCSIVRVGA